jgi:hypothetical protein
MTSHTVLQFAKGDAHLGLHACFSRSLSASLRPAESSSKSPRTVGTMAAASAAAAGRQFAFWTFAAGEVF